MSTRISFFSIISLSAKSLAVLTERMAEEGFDQNHAAGFLISRQTAASVEGRYVQKISDVVKGIDPLGNSFEFSRVVFNEQRFELGLKTPQLTLFNPSSAAQSLLGRLLEYADFKIAVEPITLPIKHMLNEIGTKFTNVHVYSVSTDAFNLDDCSTARISVESSADARLRAKALLRAQKVEFSIVKCEFEYADRIRRCELKPGGSVTLYGDSDPVLEDAFRSIVSSVCGRLK